MIIIISSLYGQVRPCQKLSCVCTKRCLCILSVNVRSSLFADFAEKAACCDSLSSVDCISNTAEKLPRR